MTTPKDTVVIDNGTSELRAGYINDLLLTIPNKYYKIKDKISFTHLLGSTEKNMFDNDVITNFENVETIFDNVFRKIDLKEPNGIIITEKPFTPNFSRIKMLECIFELYGFNKFQLGNDALYSMKKNKIKSPCLVMSFSNSMTSFINFNNGIKGVSNLNFGGKQCKKYIQEMLSTKFIIKKTNDAMINEIINNLKVSVNYNEEVINILNKAKEKITVDEYFPSFLQFIPEIKEEEPKKIKKKIEKEKSTVIKNSSVGSEESEINEEGTEEEFYEEMEAEEEEYVDEPTVEPENKTEEEEKKIARKENIAYFSSLYRFKQKIAKELNKLLLNISKLEENYEVKTNLEGYIEKMKKKFENYKETFKQRDIILRELKNKRSYYFLLRNKDLENITDEKEMEQYDKICWAENPENFVELQKEMEETISVIKTYEPNFEPFEKASYDILPVMAVERRKIPEILFEPSIVNISGLGIIEVLSNVNPSNIFITGGFSQITDLAERIKIEGQSYCKKGNISVSKAKDPIYDSFYGATFLEYLPSFTKEDYFEKGGEYLIRNMEY